MHFVLRIGLALSLSLSLSGRVVAKIDASQLSVVVLVLLRLGTEALFLFPNICIYLFIWGGGAARARTIVPTDTRPSCARRKMATNRVTAEICRVTANVLITYDRQFGSRTYAEGEFQGSIISGFWTGIRPPDWPAPPPPQKKVLVPGNGQKGTGLTFCDFSPKSQCARSR